MNLAEIIRASFMATYPNPENIADVTPDVRFAAGASDAADAVLAHLRSLSPGERSDLAFGAWPEGAHVPRDPRTDDQSAGVAAEWDLADQTASEPEDERRRRHAGHGEDPFAHHDRDRTTELEETTARHEAMLTEHDGRISAVELLTHNVTELTRELRTLRNVTRRHRDELDYITGETDTLPPVATTDEAAFGQEAPHAADECAIGQRSTDPDTGHTYREQECERPNCPTHGVPYQDDDQRLGGHDQPNPTPLEDA